MQLNVIVFLVSVSKAIAVAQNNNNNLNNRIKGQNQNQGFDANQGFFGISIPELFVDVSRSANSFHCT
jgi:hypothetical protein